MNWLNINTAQSSDPLWTSSTTLAKGAWSCLMIYCTHRENDGVIVGARLWQDRQWIHATGLVADEVGDSSLWRWIGDDLHLELYPHDLQAGVISRREGGRKGGQATSEAKTAAAKVNGNAEKAKLKPSLSQGEAKLKPTKRKEMERKEKKGKDTLSSASDDAESSESLPAYDERERDWEKVWKAFPKRIDESRARREFFESDANPDEIIASLALWSVSDEWTRDGGRWIPHPAKWLERGGWAEDPPAKIETTKQPVRCTL
jgi:hypothetical protein